MLARIIFFVAGSLLLAFGIFSLSHDLTDPSEWASVEGTVLESKINSYSTRSYGRGRNYRLTVRYEYEVGGLRWVGNRAKVSDNAVAYRTDLDSIEQLKQSSFPVSAKVLVYYNPKNPKQAVLDTRPASGIKKVSDIALLSLGCLFVFAACFGKVVRTSWKI